MAVDSNNNLYEGELWLGNDSMYITSDAGQTWTSSPFSHDVGTDREWILYNPKDNALYGWYDGLKAGLETIRAPLDTPTGSNTALLAPEERIAVPFVCAAVVCAHVADEVNGVPVIEGSESPGIPAVDPKSGTVYFPFGYQVAGKGIGIAETTDGINFTYQYVNGAGHGSLGDVDNDFPVAAVDGNGTLYVAWVEDKPAQGHDYHVYVASSKDQGATWVGPTDVSGGISNTAVFPTMAAGAGGRVVIGWYGSSTAGDSNDVNERSNLHPNGMKDASWDVYVAESVNADSASPSFDQVELLDPNFHTGTISTQGLGGAADRSLLDFFTIGVDNKTGNAVLTYTRDKGAGTAIMFAKQNGGCNLLSDAPCPTAGPSPTPSPSDVIQATTVDLTDAVPTSAQYSDQLPLVAELRDASGSAIGGQTVTFNLIAGDQVVRQASATTDPYGIASTSLGLDVHPGEYSLSVAYSGVSNTYTSSQDSQVLDVLRKDTTTSASLQGKGSKETISARLTRAYDSTGGIEGGVLSLYADGSYVGDATTDGSGRATFDVPPGSRSKKTVFEVRYPGNEYYGASSGQAS
jgi:hypothetical protein